ncbi:MULTISPECIES: glutamate synthase large subunit [Gammaproteobacteria]|uniref:glutamate synthase large subunit n=1 Tax=Gammaproteobacteria TaxID=1236 RepID=UPI000DD0DFBE|nr:MULTISPECIES: glutamate synthase large subunit [Gammaproteobacteria]RTE87761.1 glutamate synthase large subunit [Aliidiomarina sp. B3213]TCZ92457.1 glutamate synthase large subunit [Lysobacter sp. N42]
MSLYSADTQANDAKDNCGFGLIAHTEGVRSHDIVSKSITAVSRMAHRGAVNADGKTGDGCGLLLQIPESFFQAIAEQQGWNLGKKFAVGQIFLSQDKQKSEYAKKVVETELQREMFTIHGWRLVPTEKEVLGELALDTCPDIQQIFISAQPGWRKKDVERRLFMAKRRIEKQLDNDPDFYICSLSCLVVVYKGLMQPKDLGTFFLDLSDDRLETSICVFHQRFSTNTKPRWPLAQPFRFLAHNGEINTVAGNRAWAKARAYKFHSPLLPDLHDAAPFVQERGSDSASLDNMLELLLAGGMDLFRAMRMLVPPAWQGNPTMPEELRAFYEFNSMHMEPWDGPAGVVMSNGRHAACSLDRNGLRPARYVLTEDHILTIASEVGIWDYEESKVVQKGRLGPGEMIAVDTYTGKIWNTAAVDQDLMSRHPYKDWLDEHIQRLTPFAELKAEKIGERLFDDTTMQVLQKAFVYTREEVEQVLFVLANDGHEATGSMGDDTPIAALSQKPRVFYDYFRQQFAQVTNPPIDPIRERHVMSLATCIGREKNIFNETAGYARRVLFESPVLMYTDLVQLKELEPEHYAWQSFSLNYDPKKQTLKEAVQELTNRVVTASKERNIVIIILSDRELETGQTYIPAAIATGAVQQALIENDLRCDTNIIVETASARDPHHFAVLIGVGATAVYPFLAYEVIEQLVSQEKIPLRARDAVENFRNGINKGLLKILSKMGISCVASYRGAGLFELLGVSKDIHQLCFPSCHLRLEGLPFEEIEKDTLALCQQARNTNLKLPHGGYLKFVYDGEYHAYNPGVVMTLQQAINQNSKHSYKEYTQQVNSRPVSMLRDLWTLNYPKDVSDVEPEPVENLYPRFDSAAMSIGALSPEAHEAIAVGMNTLGAFSNSGEGGEDPARFDSLRNSRIKQIASGRFGVTPHYLVNADVLQIKIAQGAKPGEGGQLPGEKVTAEIAKLRHSIPGVTLISPPPHHDIYSIEDLAQLIFDLKQVNPNALVSVKLVSEPGIGTIATGVAKAYADLITVSGYDGGTGASPLTSVKYAGSPWELGLAEVHEALVSNNLRHKVRLQVDGGLKTGLDVIKAAILGAESFGFGTGPMVALGCKYLRICHLNNCATGIATQDRQLREEFYTGLPEKVSRYFEFLGEEVRTYLSALGVEKLTDLIGRIDLLQLAENLTDRQRLIQVQPILDSVQVKSAKTLFCSENNTPDDKGQLNQTLLSKFRAAVEQKAPQKLSFKITNQDRSVGASLSGFIAQTHGRLGLTGSPIHAEFKGNAGQSFGVWNAPGLHLKLIGDANDYVGKGMAGGRIVVKSARDSKLPSQHAVSMGNTCLYGATGGRLYAAGHAGERFAVRNSGAIAVIEGVGDHACEYMTGGIVVILGPTGINFGAGMTGGLAIVHDAQNSIAKKINPELVEVLPLSLNVLKEHLRGLLHEHYESTESAHTHEILRNFDTHLAHFKLVKGKDTDVHDVLGRRARGTEEIRVQVS